MSKSRRQAAAQESLLTQPSVLDVSALLEEDRVRHVQAQLEASRTAYDDLCAEHQRLQEQRRAEEREGYEVAASARRDAQAKDAQLARMQQDLAGAARAQQDAEALALQREELLQAAFVLERQRWQGDAAALQAQLDSLEEFRQQREAMQAELQRLRLDGQCSTEEAAEKVIALQRRLLELEHGEGEDAAASASEAGGSEDGEEGGGGSLEADLHRLLAHSRKVADEMKHYGQEAEDLQREMRGLEAERAALLRDVALKEEAEQQYAKRGTLQAREIRNARSRIGTLERGMVQLAADYERQKVQLGQSLRAQLADAVTEQNGLRRLLRLRTRELRQVRGLAQEVLLQRSEVEAFLVSSILQVRGEMAAAAAGGPAEQRQEQPRDEQQQQQQQRQDGAPSAGLGGESSSNGNAAKQLNGSISSGSGPAAQQVDIRDLSWGDRERILRLLFSKINRAAHQRAAAPPPAPPLPQAPSPPPPPQPQPPMVLRGAATEAGPAGLA